MGERDWTIILACVFAALTLAHCLALFVTGWGHVFADWLRDRLRRHG